MHLSLTVAVLCLCVSVCLHVTKLAAAFLVYESKCGIIIIIRFLNCVTPNAWIVWIPRCLALLGSFADSKLLDFSRASDSLHDFIYRCERCCPRRAFAVGAT